MERLPPEIDRRLRDLEKRKPEAAKEVRREMEEVVRSALACDFEGVARHGLRMGMVLQKHGLKILDVAYVPVEEGEELKFTELGKVPPERLVEVVEQVPWMEKALVKVKRVVYEPAFFDEVKRILVEKCGVKEAPPARKIPLRIIGEEVKPPRKYEREKRW